MEADFCFKLTGNVVFETSESTRDFNNEYVCATFGFARFVCMLGGGHRESTENCIQSAKYARFATNGVCPFASNGVTFTPSQIRKKYIYAEICFTY